MEAWWNDPPSEGVVAKATKKANDEWLTRAGLLMEGAAADALPPLGLPGSRPSLSSSPPSPAVEHSEQREAGREEDSLARLRDEAQPQDADAAARELVEARLRPARQHGRHELDRPLAEGGALVVALPALDRDVGRIEAGYGDGAGRPREAVAADHDRGHLHEHRVVVHRGVQGHVAPGHHPHARVRGSSHRVVAPVVAAERAPTVAEVADLRRELAQEPHHAAELVRPGLGDDVRVQGLAPVVPEIECARPAPLKKLPASLRRLA